MMNYMVQVPVVFVPSVAFVMMSLPVLFAHLESARLTTLSSFCVIRSDWSTVQVLLMPAYSGR